MARADNSTTYAAAGIIALVLLIDAFTGDGDPNDPYLGDDEEQRPTLTLQRMNQLADTLEVAFLGNWFLDDEELATASILECRNNADLLGLMAAFGERGYMWPHASRTLTEWVAYLYNAQQKAELNAGLRARGITYTFP